MKGFLTVGDVPIDLYSITETEKLNNLRSYYYKHLYTELPNECH